MDAERAVAAGVISTAAMTAVCMVEPAIGLPRIAIGETLSHAMTAISSHTAVGSAGGWLAGVVVGIGFAMFYAAYLDTRLPGTPFLRGLLFGCATFLLAELVFAPLSGGGMFSQGDPRLLVGGLLGNLTYGGVLGYVYGGAGVLTSTARAG
jgi:Family of unknown function (DUF6789)